MVTLHKVLGKGEETTQETKHEANDEWRQEDHKDAGGTGGRDWGVIVENISQ